MTLNFSQIKNEQVICWNTYGYAYSSNHLKKNISQYLSSVEQIESLNKDTRESLFYYEEIEGLPKLCRIEKFIEDNKL